MTGPMLPRPIAPAPQPAPMAGPPAAMPEGMGEQPGVEKVACPKCGFTFDPEAAKAAGGEGPAPTDVKSFFEAHRPGAAMTRPAGPMR